MLCVYVLSLNYFYLYYRQAWHYTCIRDSLTYTDKIVLKTKCGLSVSNDSNYSAQSYQELLTPISQFFFNYFTFLMFTSWLLISVLVGVKNKHLVLIRHCIYIYTAETPSGTFMNKRSANDFSGAADWPVSWPMGRLLLPLMGITLHPLVLVKLTGST